MTKQLVKFVQSLREEDLKKLPSISETIDWARVILLMHADSLDSDLVRDTLNVLLKFEQDIASVERRSGGADRLLVFEEEEDGGGQQRGADAGAEHPFELVAVPVVALVQKDAD